MQRPTKTSIRLWPDMYFDLADPWNSPLPITSIAHALSLICRYNGQVDQMYSVAQHSVMASYYAPAGTEYAHLMHDAHEALIGDMTSPCQQMVPGFKAFAAEMQRMVLERYGLTMEEVKATRPVDLLMLRTEQRDIANADGDIWPWSEGLPPYARKLRFWPSDLAEQIFLRRFYELTKNFPATPSNS